MDKILAPIKKRILEYLDKKEYTKEYFFKMTSISRSNFKGEALKSEIGGDKIANIITIFEDISPDWLLTGKGEMLRNSQILNNDNHERRIEELEYIIEIQKELIKTLKQEEAADTAGGAVAG